MYIHTHTYKCITSTRNVLCIRNVYTQGPGGWDDVLTPRKLQGQCNKESCDGKYAVST